LKFPYRKSVRIRRDLKHFEEWLKVVLGEAWLDDAIFHASLYKIFFLYNINLYPTSKAQGSFIPIEFSIDLQRQGLTDSGALSCSQAASRIMAVIRWQQYQLPKYVLQDHRPKIDTNSLLNELIPFYRKLKTLVNRKELTYKKAIQSETVYKVFRRHELLGANPFRDAVILQMTWVAGCTPGELINFSIQDIEPLDALNWIYHHKGAQEITPVKLDNYTMVTIFELIGKMSEAELSSERLLNFFDGNSVRPFTENEIEIIIEQHYRFAEALYGFDPYKGVNASERQELDLSPAEESELSGMLKAMYERLVTRRQGQALPPDEDCRDDWDIAVQRARMRKQTMGQQDTEYKRRDDNDDQADWDNAVITRKEP